MKIDANLTDPVLRKYASSIKDFGYLSENFNAYQRSGAGAKFSDRANLVPHSQSIRAM